MRFDTGDNRAYPFVLGLELGLMLIRVGRSIATRLGQVRATGYGGGYETGLCLFVRRMIPRLEDPGSDNPRDVL